MVATLLPREPVWPSREERQHDDRPPLRRPRARGAGAPHRRHARHHRRGRHRLRALRQPAVRAVGQARRLRVQLRHRPPAPRRAAHRLLRPGQRARAPAEVGADIGRPRSPRRLGLGRPRGVLAGGGLQQLGRRGGDGRPRHLGGPALDTHGAGELRERARLLARGQVSSGAVDGPVRGDLRCRGGRVATAACGLDRERRRCDGHGAAAARRLQPVGGDVQRHRVGRPAAHRRAPPPRRQRRALPPHDGDARQHARVAELSGLGGLARAGAGPTAGGRPCARAKARRHRPPDPDAVGLPFRARIHGARVHRPPVEQLAGPRGCSAWGHVARPQTHWRVGGGFTPR